MYTVIQAVHSLLYIVAKCHFFSVVTWKDIIKYLQKCEGCTHFCEILYIIIYIHTHTHTSIYLHTQTYTYSNFLYVKCFSRNQNSVALYNYHIACFQIWLWRDPSMNEKILQMFSRPLSNSISLFDSQPLGDRSLPAIADICWASSWRHLYAIPPQL